MSSHPTRTEKCEDNDDDEHDEYTYDDLDGVDLDSIPELCLPPTQHARLSPPPQPSPQPPQSQQSQATDPQRLASSSLPRVVEHSACPVPTSTVADNPSATAARSPDSTGRSTTPSTDYGLEDEIDDEFLKELDDLETTLLESTNQSRKAAVPSSSAKVLAPTDPAATTSQLISHPPLRQASEEKHRDLPTRNHYQKATEDRSSQKRPHSQKGNDSGSAIPTESPEQAVRGGEGPSKKLKKLMDDFEDEMSCPICCDLFACAYLFNPCGHSYCGDCALRWMEKNKDAPVCAVCRTHVSKEGAMIANISLDNAVQRHVDALGENGVVEWQRGGTKLVEWTTRKEEWKTSGITRMFDVLKTRPRRRK